MTHQAALVTGASRGIGLAAAEALAREGFAIALNATRMHDDLKKAAARLRALGVAVVEAPFDVADISLYDTQLSAVEERIGPLTTLVNNAGVGVLARGDPLDVSAASYDRCMAINSRAMFFLCQAFARRLLARPRAGDAFHSIVNVTSANAVAVAVPRTEYCASKAAAAMISKAFAVRLGAESIAVYDVQPGLIDTDMTKSVIETYAQRARDGLTLLPRIGQPEDTGAVIAALAAGRLPYTTGQAISADGGMLVPRF